MQLLNVLITCLEIASDAKEYLKQTLSLEHLLGAILRYCRCYEPNLLFTLKLG